MARAAATGMPLAGHLRELRRRLAICAAAILAGAVVGWLLADPIWRLIQSPVAAIGPSQDRLAALNFDTVTGAFDLRMQLAIQLGVIVSAPVWLWQIFAFVVPGLTRKETRATFLFLAAALPLFTAGAAMGVWILPHMVQLLTSFAPGQTASYLSASAYYDFVLKLVLATGVAFVLPVFIVLLNAIGVLRGRTVLRHWRPALIAILAFAAITTPAADIVSMLILATPMAGLYLSASTVAIVADRRRDKRANALVA